MFALGFFVLQLALLLETFFDGAGLLEVDEFGVFASVTVLFAFGREERHYILEFENAVLGFGLDVRTAHGHGWVECCVDLKALKQVH